MRDSTGKCLNCDTGLAGKYCYACGQKASTHRITFIKFLEHDLFHGVLHLDRGIFFTLKTLFFRAGYAARQYLTGSRVKYFNIFTLFILVVSVKVFLDSRTGDSQFINSSNDDVSDEKVKRVIGQYYKLIFLFCIPVMSLFSRILFSKFRYNFTEHIVLNCFVLTAALLYSLVFSLAGYLLQNEGFNLWGSLLMFIYVFLAYFQAAKGTYVFLDYAWRVLVMVVLFLSSVFFTFLITVVQAYGGKFTGFIGL